MGWQNMLTELVPVITDLIGVAEQAFSNKPKSGEQKKAFVVQAAKDIVTGGEKLSTGGAKGTWDFADMFVPKMVDSIAGFFFKDKETKPKIAANGVTRISGAEITAKPCQDNECYVSK